MPGFQSTRLVTEGALEPFFFLYTQSTRLATEGALEPFLFLYTDDSIQGNPETCNQSSMMLNYEVKNIEYTTVASIMGSNCSLCVFFIRNTH